VCVFLCSEVTDGAGSCDVEKLPKCREWITSVSLGWTRFVGHKPVMDLYCIINQKLSETRQMDRHRQ